MQHLSVGDDINYIQQNVVTNYNMPVVIYGPMLQIAS